jgi:endonuclease III
MEKREVALEIMHRLEAVYHADWPTRGHGMHIPPVDELVLTYLSQATTDVNSWRGYSALRERWPTWEAVADALEDDVEAVIRPCGLSHQKAPRIQAALRRIREERGSITLDWLAHESPEAARDYLMSFPGVGRKTASCVLLFSLGMPAMPVDTHVLRVTRRLELVPPKAIAEQAHDVLEALLPVEAYLPFHINIIAHGRQCCHAQRPACERCPVQELCPFGKSMEERWNK